MKGTIKSSEEISGLFTTAKRVNHRALVALIAETNNKRGLSGRVAFIAGKKLGTAPQRSRAKRVLREAARRQGAPWEGFDVVLIAKNTTLTASFQEILVAMERVSGVVASEKASKDE